MADLTYGEKLAYVAGTRRGGRGSTAWSDITDKPTEFPPEAHEHTVSDISDFPSIPTSPEEVGAAAAVHTHAQADVTGLTAALAGKQATIADLSTIRSGAALGATALQEVPSTYRTAAEQDEIHDATKQDTLTLGANMGFNSEGKLYSRGIVWLNYDNTGICKTWTPRVYYTFTELYNLINFANSENRDIKVYYRAWGDVMNLLVMSTTEIWFECLDSTYDYILKLKSDDTCTLTTQVLALKSSVDAKQDKLIAGANITIAEDGKTISSTGGGSGTPVGVALDDDGNIVVSGGGGSDLGITSDDIAHWNLAYEDYRAALGVI